MSFSFKAMLACLFGSLVMSPSVALAERKKDRTKDDNDRPQSSMDQARGPLEFAQTLGYGTKKDFDKMYAQLKEITDKTADNKFGAGWFAKIKSSIADILKSSQPPKNG